jgi:acyl-coenzyme A thioesterase PaaI-like protein
MVVHVNVDEDSERRVRRSFEKQGLMATLGATLESLSPGAVEIALRPHPAISQQHGFVQSGAVTAIADSAAGYAALSFMPPGTGVLSRSSRSISWRRPREIASLPAAGS